MTGLGSLLCREIEQRATAVEQAIWDLTETQLWSRVAPTANSVGNLVLHLAGNLQTYVIQGVGGRPYERRRPQEFTATGLARAEVGRRLREAVGGALNVLASAKEEVLSATHPGPEFSGLPKAALALHAVEHLGYHTGQIVLLVKILTSQAPGPASTR